MIDLSFLPVCLCVFSSVLFAVCWPKAFPHLHLGLLQRCLRAMAPEIPRIIRTRLGVARLAMQDTGVAPSDRTPSCLAQASAISEVIRIHLATAQFCIKTELLQEIRNIGLDADHERQLVHLVEAIPSATARRQRMQDFRYMEHFLNDLDWVERLAPEAPAPPMVKMNTLFDKVWLAKCRAPSEGTKRRWSAFLLVCDGRIAEST